MRTTGQIGLALVAVIGLVAGATYLSQYQSPPPPPPPTPVVNRSQPDPVPVDELSAVFENPNIEWVPSTLSSFELGLVGYHDFWIRNPAPGPMLLGLEALGCTKCTTAYLLALDPEQMKKFHQWVACSMASQVGSALGGAVPFGSHFTESYLATPKLVGYSDAWQKLEIDPVRGKVIPAKGEGFIRLRWDSKGGHLGEYRIKADIWSRPESSVSRLVRVQNLAVPLNYIPAKMATTDLLNVDNLETNGEKSVEFLVVSFSRAGFETTVTNPKNSPFVTWSVSDLTAAECGEQSVAMNRAVLSGKRVIVHVRERVSEQVKMDVGPFNVRLLVGPAPTPEEEAPVVIAGTIHGEFTVGLPEDKGRVDLRTFSSRAGITKMVPITAEYPNLDLEMDKIRIEPESLKSLLKARVERAGTKKEGKPGRWNLHLVFHPGLPPGKLPEGSAVFLPIAGATPPRQVRVPIYGMAYQ